VNLFQNDAIVIDNINDLDSVVEQLLTKSPEEIEKLGFLLKNNPEFVIQFRGERFDDGYVPYEMLRAITDIQKKIDSYFEGFLSTNSNYHAMKPQKIKVKFEKGCVIADIITALPKEAVTNFLSSINGAQITFSTIFFITAFFSNKAYQNHLQQKSEELKVKLVANKESNLMNIQEQTLNLALQAIDALQENQQMEKAKNNMMKSIIKNAEKGDTIEFKNTLDSRVFTIEDKDEFKLEKEPIEKYITIEEYFNIRSISEHKVSPIVEIYNGTYNKMKAETKFTEYEIIELAKAINEHRSLRFKIKALERDGTIVSAEIYELIGVQYA